MEIRKEGSGGRCRRLRLVPFVLGVFPAFSRTSGMRAFTFLFLRRGADVLFWIEVQRGCAAGVNVCVCVCVCVAVAV